MRYGSSIAVDGPKVSPLQLVRSGLIESYQLLLEIYKPHRPDAPQIYEDPSTNDPKQITDGISVDIVLHALTPSHSFSHSTLPFGFFISSEFMWFMASTTVGAKR